MKRKISSLQYEILKKELRYLEEIGKLPEKTSEELLQEYEIINNEPVAKSTSRKTVSLNSIQIISIIGAVLIGLGVLSFVASNWSAMTSIEKFVLLLVTLISSYLLAWGTEEKKPNTSKALYYIGAFIYGAEIFYIGQMFHLGGDIGTAFLAWSLGLLPLAFYRKDHILFAVAFGLFYLAIELIFMIPSNGEPSLWLIVILPLLFIGIRFITVFQRALLIANFALLYQFIELRFMVNSELHMGWIILLLASTFALNKIVFPKEKYLIVVNFLLLYQFIELILFVKAIDHITYLIVFGLLTVILLVIGHIFMNKSIVLFPINVIIGIQFLCLILYHFDVEQLFVYFFVIFAIGIVFTHYRIKEYDDVMKWMGLIFQLVTGLMLTFPFSYGPLDITRIWIFFGLAYIVYGMFLVYQNKVFGVLLVSLLIFRFYVDLSLVFMNKSIAFFIGGLLLLGLGYWFEKTRRGDGKGESQKKTK
ncbi:DUF2157 domain-containing protein [Metabacillus litoralis]|uniref:DUF2157 domain-containing protein n=1 Tax=Metabacillus litoralis TaxID=152268 RepID=A0A5C6VLI4_9BACI|nr:DUF2157 domain-containing protein [Metabacillus litoralis]TXC85839.1 DUF2157 domain-containing protein [Metabacillus litoralis]